MIDERHDTDIYIKVDRTYFGAITRHVSTT